MASRRSSDESTRFDAGQVIRALRRRAAMAMERARPVGEVIRALRRRAAGAVQEAPTRLALIGGAGALVLIVLGLQFGGTPSHAPDQAASSESAAVEPIEPVADAAAPENDAAQQAVDTQTETASAPVRDVADEPEPAGTIDADRAWDYVQVASGDTMEIIFRRQGLSPRLLHRVVHLDEHTRELVDLRPGDEVAFDIDGGELRALRAEFDDENWLFVEREGEKLASRLEPRNLEVRVVEVEAEITSSLFNAGKNAGLTDNMILRLAGIFGWDIDFALDIRRGDRFALVFEEIYRDDQFLRQGSILAARFINQGEHFAAVRYDAGDGPDYYDPQGRPMRKQFLRAPLNFTRVTSNFNPRRFHPVTRRVRPHNGTDYGAPTGTPVWAAGDGTVIEAGYGRANGNYIFIKHGNHIVTRYLHLSRKQVKRGDRVRQGETIGRVGATGLATGPHLHYEFLVHGSHRDPRTVDLPEVDPLPDDELPDYEQHAEPWLDRLDDLLAPQNMLADTGSEDRRGDSRRATESRPPSATAPQ